MKARIKFRKYGCLRFIGHLDVMRYFQKVMRRAQIPIAFTGGYSPHMIMSFAQPLGVGVTSDGEYLDIELTEPIPSGRAVRQMNEVMAEGIEIVSFLEIPEEKKYSGMTITAAAEYEITLLESGKCADRKKRIPESLGKSAEEFLAQDEITVMKKTKRSEKEVDIKPMIYEMEVTDEAVRLFLATGSENNLKPDLVLEEFLKFAGEEPEHTPFHVHRLDVYAKKEGAADSGDAHVKGAGLVTLESLGREITEER